MSTDLRTMTQSASGKWATFMLAGEMFALRVEDVQEVLMMQPLTPVPMAPDYIVGLLNLRGQIMPSVDLRKRLMFPVRAGGANDGVLLVVNTSEGLLSLLVDEIGDVLELPKDDWRPAPDTLDAKHRTYVFGICPIENRMVLGLRTEELGSDDSGTRARKN